jgi:hypothetical protein
MKRYLKMVWFILILGTLTSVVFVGMEIWTRPLIDANAANELKSIVLSANDISFNTGNISAVFDENIEVEEVGDFTFYVEKNSGRISYQFSGAVSGDRSSESSRWKVIRKRFVKSASCNRKKPRVWAELSQI